MKRLVIDAGVVLKWYLTDEEYGQKALNLLGKYISNELDFLALSLLEYEVINGLTIAQKRGRIKEEKNSFGYRWIYGFNAFSAPSTVISFFNLRL